VATERGARTNDPAAEASLTSALLAQGRRPVSPATRRRAVLHWLDWIGCVAAAAQSPVAGVLRAWEPNPGAPRRVEALLGLAQGDHHAVLLDAGPANVEEMDDLHREAILHPGPVVIPALAALARQRPLPAGRVLDALVRGYDAMIRIGRAVGRRHYFYWHNTATAGAFGAAAACADALDLSPEQSVWALGNAGTQAAGLWQVRLEPVMSKQLHTGHAAWAGLTAASLASAGFTGPARILEGERGFFAAMCEGGDFARVAQAEDDWLILQTSFKPWPACRHTHATIDCVLALRERLGGEPLRYEACTVETFGDALAICSNFHPVTRTEAKFSLQYAVAAAARFGPLRPGHFDPACVATPELQAAASRVALERAADLDALYPAHYGARVSMTLADGRVVSHHEQDSLGDPERALSADAVIGKAVELMRYGGVAAVRAAAAVDAAEALLREDARPGATARMDEPFPRALLAPLFA
jgi:2-methylcitrate dehydratase PrpD